MFGIEASRQVQRSQDRHRALRGIAKKAAALIVDEIELARIFGQVVEDAAIVFGFASLVLIRDLCGRTCREKFAGYA